MKKTIIYALAIISLASCKKQSDQEAMQPQVQNIAPVTQSEEADSLHYKFIITASKLPCYFKRMKGDGKWDTDTITTSPSVILDPYVDPGKHVGGLAFKDYQFMASYILTGSVKDMITIKAEYLGKSTESTNISGNTFAAIQLKNLK